MLRVVVIAHAADERVDARVGAVVGLQLRVEARDLALDGADLRLAGLDLLLQLANLTGVVAGGKEWRSLRSDPPTPAPPVIACSLTSSQPHAAPHPSHFPIQDKLELFQLLVAPLLVQNGPFCLSNGCILLADEGA